jgi:GT2 family glycosyltransferase
MPTPQSSQPCCAAESDSEPVRPQVLVIVLNYGGWQDTVACLYSLQALAYPAWQLLVVDNASPDSSVQEIRQAFPNVELLINERNLGFGAGNNQGLARAIDRGYKYAWVLNNDTRVEPNSLSALVETAESDRRIAAVGSLIHAMVRPDELLAHGGGRFVSMWGHAYHVRDGRHGLDYLTGASLLLRTEALREAGLFDERYFFLWEDVDLSLRLQQAGWKLAVANSSRVWHRDGGTAAMGSPFRMEHHAIGLVLTLRSYATLPACSALPILLYYVYFACRRGSLSLLLAGLRGWLRGWHMPAATARSRAQTANR